MWLVRCVPLLACSRLSLPRRTPAAPHPAPASCSAPAGKCTAYTSCCDNLPCEKDAAGTLVEVRLHAACLGTTLCREQAVRRWPGRGSGAHAASPACAGSS